MMCRMILMLASAENISVTMEEVVDNIPCDTGNQMRLTTICMCVFVYSTWIVMASGEERYKLVVKPLLSLSLSLSRVRVWDEQTREC